VSARVALGVLLLLPLASCRSLERDEDPWTAENTVARVGTVEFALTEHAYDDDYHVPPGRPHSVDFASTLALHFATDTAGAAPASNDWKAINSWLERLDDLSVQRRALESKVIDLSDRNALSELQLEDDAFTKSVNGLVAEALALLETMVPKSEITGIRVGKFDGKKESQLQNIARWFRQRHRQLVLEGKEIKDGAPKDQITVLAFRRRGKGKQERLHVENYDTIEAASDFVPDRFSLALTDRELSRLKMEIQQSERAVAFMRSIEGRLDELGVLRKELVTEVKRTLEKIRALSADDLADLDANVASGKAFLASLRGGSIEEARLVQLEAHLDTIGKTNDLRRRWVALVEGAQGALDADDATDLTAFLSGVNGLLGTIEQLKRDGLALVQETLALATAVAELTQGAAALLDEATLEDWHNALPADLRDALDAYVSRAQPLVTSLQTILTSLDNGKKADELFQGYTSDSVSSEGLDSISRDIGNLLDGRVELGGAVEEGDAIVLRVELRDAEGNTKESADYLLKVSRQGWFRNVTGNAILARASRGTDSAKDWKPNVAALINWQYRERYPNGWGSAMNWLQPAIGVHAASLDMGDESVEFGLGGNLTFLGGLISFGVGENISLSEGDGTYMFVATDLLRLLGNLQPGDGAPTER
jgi:hypothetical protein